MKPDIQQGGVSLIIQDPFSRKCIMEVKTAYISCLIFSLKE